jgi:hypothetical protein
MFSVILFFFFLPLSSCFYFREQHKPLTPTDEKCSKWYVGNDSVRMKVATCSNFRQLQNPWLRGAFRGSHSAVISARAIDQFTRVLLAPKVGTAVRVVYDDQDSNSLN